MENGTFSWGGTQDDVVILRNINLRIQQGQLVAVVGTVGSGKSSLLSAFLGEMDKLSGRVNTKVLNVLFSRVTNAFFNPFSFLSFFSSSLTHHTPPSLMI